MPHEAAAPFSSSLAGAEWLQRPATRAVLAALAGAGHEARIVGGAVRNALLGEPVTDIDIATTATPDDVMATARAAGLEAIPTGIEHGTVTVVAHRIPFEVTTLREDIETFGRRARVAFTADWEADARRRDFTVNALYCDADGRIFDPLGGLSDLARRRIRFIGDARERIREDALRILRFFRFTARYAREAPDGVGLAACIAERTLIPGLSAERIRIELLKLLEAPGAADAIATMAAHGLIVPILRGAPRVGLLARLVAQDASALRAPDSILRLSVLAVAVEEDVDRLGERLRLSRAERDALVVVDPRLMGLAALDAAGRRRALYRIGVPVWQRMCRAGAASTDTAAACSEWDALATLPDRWEIPRFPLGGRDAIALGLSPGPQIGALLSDLEAEWIAEDFAASPGELSARLSAGVAAKRESG